MMRVNKLLLSFLAFLMLSAPAHASLDGWDSKPGDPCAAAEEGHTRRNASASLDDSEITLICDGSQWQSAGAGSDTLAGLSCSSGQIAKWNGAAWACAADDAGSGGITALTGDVTGSGSGSVATTIANNAVVAAKIASNAVTSAKIAANAVTTAKIADAAVSIPKIGATGTPSSSVFLRGDGQWVAPPSGADNLGNHTATANIQLGTHWLSGDGGNEGITVDSAGRVRINYSSATYDVWLQGGEVTSGGDRNLAILGRADTDTLYLNYGGEYSGGTVIGGVISGNGSGLTALNAANLASGTVPAARLPAYTGDVTKAAGATALTIANSAVTNAKIANATIVATTKLSATGTKNATTFLRGDNTWAAPPSGGGVVQGTWCGLADASACSPTTCSSATYTSRRQCSGQTIVSACPSGYWLYTETGYLPNGCGFQGSQTLQLCKRVCIKT